MLEAGSEIVFAGIEFRVVQVSETYYKLIPTQRPDWLFENIRQLFLEEEYRKMELSKEMVATFLRAKNLYENNITLIDRYTLANDQIVLDLTQELRKELPNVSVFEVVELLETFDITSTDTT